MDRKIFWAPNFSKRKSENNEIIQIIQNSQKDRDTLYRGKLEDNASWIIWFSYTHPSNSREEKGEGGERERERSNWPLSNQ